MALRCSNIYEDPPQIKQLYKLHLSVDEGIFLWAAAGLMLRIEHH